MDKITKKAAKMLISESHPNEKSVQLWLAMLLVSLDHEVKLEYAVPSGHMDIFLPHRRVVIETKPQGTANPNDVRDPDSDETQFAQCARYVREKWEHDRGEFKKLRIGYGLPWKAILTDGRVWWMWQWDILPKSKLGKAQCKVKNRRFSSEKELVVGVRDLIGAPWQPGLVL